jgi:hypothetical protein
VLACHAFFWQKATMADRCEQCHADIAAELQDPTTLHGDQLKKTRYALPVLSP